MSAPLYGLVDIGGTKLLAAASLDKGPIERVLRQPTTAGDDSPIETLSEMLEEAGQGRAFGAISMAVPGPFDRKQGTLINPPGMKSSWHRLAVRDALEAVFKCPVFLENDANCAALAEAREGAGRGYRTIIYYTVSTGIGSGIARHGHLLISRHDTEGGHQVLWPAWLGGPPCDCGGAGCLEALVSGRALARRFGKPSEEIQDQEVWDEVGRWLGLAIVNATALFDPDCVIFGGGVCNAWDRFSPSLHDTVAAHLHLQPQPVIARASLGPERNLLGARCVLEQERHV